MQGARLKAGGRAFAHIAQFHPELTAFRRDLHAHPELGFEEVYTAARVVEALKLCGVDEVHEGIGRTGVVAFPNFAHWPNRLSILRGRMPVTRRLPYQWYDTPNIRVGTYKDFEVLATKNDLRILDSFGLQDGEEVRWLPNARAGTAVFHFEHA